MFGRVTSPSHLGISYARYSWSRKAVGTSSPTVRWSWCASPANGARMTSAESTAPRPRGSPSPAPRRRAAGPRAGRAARSRGRRPAGTRVPPPVPPVPRSAVPVSSTYLTRMPGRRPARLAACPPPRSRCHRGARRSRGRTAARPSAGRAAACHADIMTLSLARPARPPRRAPGRGVLRRRPSVPGPRPSRGSSPVVHLLQLRPLLDGIGRRPVALVRVGEHLPLLDQPGRTSSTRSSPSLR